MYEEINIVSLDVEVILCTRGQFCVTCMMESNWRSIRHHAPWPNSDRLTFFITGNSDDTLFAPHAKGINCCQCFCISHLLCWLVSYLCVVHKESEHTQERGGGEKDNEVVYVADITKIQLSSKSREVGTKCRYVVVRKCFWSGSASRQKVDKYLALKQATFVW